MGTALGRGLLRSLASFVLFAPRRPVSIEMVEPPDFPRTGRAAMNRQLEAFYNEDAPPARYVPYTPWERGGVRDLPEPASSRPTGDPKAVSGAIREQVLARIREVTGIERLTSDLELARDLGMDSLSRMDLLLFVEQEFGHPCSDPEALSTVGDVMLAAAGQAIQGMSAIAPAPARWFASRALAPMVPEGATIPSVFLRQAARGPSRALLADANGGVRTFRDVITAVYALRPHLARLEGEHLGIMLPASCSAFGMS
jgi:long-chain-fatty-acid--[acyl-carrier-protein] ligase